MFDGNHRVRRAVNLSGGRRRRAVAHADHHTEGGAVGGAHAHHANSTGLGKESVLETARQRRVERQRRQRQLSAATRIQTRFRMCSVRCHRAADMQEQLQELLSSKGPAVTGNGNENGNENGNGNGNGMTQLTRILNARLGLPIVAVKANAKANVRGVTVGVSQLDAWLSAYARQLDMWNGASTSTLALSTPVHRILAATLQSVQRDLDNSNATTKSTSSAVVVAETIWNHHWPPKSPQQQHQQQQHHYWKILGGIAGYCRVVDTLQRLCAVVTVVGNEDSGSAQQQDRLRSLLWKVCVDAAPVMDAARAVLGALVLSSSSSSWMASVTTEPSGDVGAWFLALVRVMTVPMTPTCVATNDNDDDDTAEQLLRATAQGIVRDRQGVVLSNALALSEQTSSAVTGSSSASARASASNCPTTLVPTTAVLQLLNHVLQEHDSLSWVVGQLLAVQSTGTQGAGLAAVRARMGMGAGGSSSSSVATANNLTTTGLLLLLPDDDEDMDDDDDMEEDEEMQDRAVAAATVTSSSTTALKKARTGARLTKRDLQTVPKLDRMYQEHVVAWQKTVLSRMANSNSQEKESLLDLAERIGLSEMWLHWGRILFTITGSASRTVTSTSDELHHEATASAVDVDVDQQLCLAQEGYVTLTANFLQGSTGLRPRQSGTNAFLTKLAFAPDFLGQLWQFCRRRLDRGQYLSLTGSTTATATTAAVTGMRQDTITYTCLTVFCDLFAHHLIALKDDQFLKNHTTMTAAPGSSSPQVTILAEEVIVSLRDLLYELYWGKPVRADHIRLPFAGGELSEEDRLQAVRGRLLLTGTKLWNSLYQIWCRLLRHTPFCDESTWWFPHMTTLTGDGAVVNHRQAAREADNDSVASMDIDSDEDDEDGNNGTTGGASMQPVSAAEAEDDAMADTFSDPKMARILTCIPQALPFGKRVKLFDSLLKADKAKTQDESAEMREVMLNMMRGEEGVTSFRERVEIRRDKLYDDAMRQLNRLGPKLKKKIQVTFVSQHGTQEAGIDGGGVFKEFIDDLIKDAFQPDTNSHMQFFSVTPLQTLTVNEDLTTEDDILTLSHYEFLGRVLGKAVYESILVEPQFCLPFLNQLLGKVNSLEDLKNFDTEYYKNLTKLLTLSADELDMAGLTLELTLGTRDYARTVELVRGGRNTSVTKQNVIQYVHLVAHQRLNVETSLQTRAFLRGFRDLVPAAWVRLFSSYELQKLISGDDSIRGMDVASLQQAMQYGGGYHPSQPVVQWFWEIMFELTPDQQRKFLKFVTSCSRQPLLGFSSLEPAPCIQQVRLPEALFADNDAESIAKRTPLPTSSTCMNLLKLPNYRSKQLMRQKLLAAIEAGAGFELS